MSDPEEDFMRYYKPPSPAQLSIIAEAVALLRQGAEHVQMRKFSNDAHPSWHALSVAYTALHIAEDLCRTGHPGLQQPEILHTNMEYLERALSDLK
jgi:hypothetical protein